MNQDIRQLQQGMHHDPFHYLGLHPYKGKSVVRAFMPHAEEVSIHGVGPMQRIPGTDLFEFYTKDPASFPEHYALNWREKRDGQWHRAISPYTFPIQISELDLYLFGEGKHQHAWQFLGAHLREIDGISGVLFSIWVPAVSRISIVGDFNGWNGLRHPMRCRGASGIWELFIPGIQPGDAYKYEIRTQHGELLLKSDPYARQTGIRPETTTLVSSNSEYPWQDQEWLSARNDWDWLHSPLSIYELHLGSWRRDENNRFINYREQADQIVEYISHLGYTHIELLPIMEHPLDESWGYQVSSYYSPTGRFGDPDDLRYLIDHCHQAGIGVFLDWVPAHFPKDAFALARFNGEPLYEHADPRRGEHKEWGTLVFNYGRHEVRNFLLSNALFWIEEYHIDGLRVDAVASMLYLDYSRNEGEWYPNQYGGREHLEAVAFIREFNELIHANYPGVITMAEESTSWPMVSRPTDVGGLGFSMKWNMGWMHDTLSYFQNDPVHRKHHHNNLTFSQIYAYSENFILPFSHDEVVHMKKSMLGKMPGDQWQQFANLRLLYSYHYLHPGKKLLFMGGEFGQQAEWSEQKALPWSESEGDENRGIARLIRDLNHLYRQEEALYYYEFEDRGFQWIDCQDREQSVLSFIRCAHGTTLLAIFNFTPVPRKDYRIGVPKEGIYQEIMNSDSTYYGGTNTGNPPILQSSDSAWMGFGHSLTLTLPPLGALLIKYRSPDH